MADDLDPVFDIAALEADLACSKLIEEDLRAELKRRSDDYDKLYEDHAQQAEDLLIMADGIRSCLGVESEFVIDEDVVQDSCRRKPLIMRRKLKGVRTIFLVDAEEYAQRLTKSFDLNELLGEIDKQGDVND